MLNRLFSLLPTRFLTSSPLLKCLKVIGMANFLNRSNVFSPNCIPILYPHPLRRCCTCPLLLCTRRCGDLTNEQFVETRLSTRSPQITCTPILCGGDYACDEKSSRSENEFFREGRRLRVHAYCTSDQIFNSNGTVTRTHSVNRIVHGIRNLNEGGRTLTSRGQKRKKIAFYANNCNGQRLYVSFAKTSTSFYVDRW
jgi:hypothetical protein